MNWSDAQNWIDILDHVWIGLVAICVAGIPAYFSARNHQGIKKIQDQVVNGHKSPMRLDLDRVIETLAEMGGKVDIISHGVTNLREELMQEETRRRTSIQELRDDFDRKISQVLDRFR